VTLNKRDPMFVVVFLTHINIINIINTIIKTIIICRRGGDYCSKYTHTNRTHVQTWFV